MEQNWYRALNFEYAGIKPIDFSKYSDAQIEKYWFVYNHLQDLLTESACGYKHIEYGVYDNNGSIEEYVRVCNSLDDKYDGRYICVTKDSKIALARDVIDNLY